MASTTANVISTAGDAPLSVADPSSDRHGPPGQRRVLPAAAAAGPRPNAANAGTAFNNVGSSASPLNLLTWSAPVSNDAVTLEFKQPINANDAPSHGLVQQGADVHAVAPPRRKTRPQLGAGISAGRPGSTSVRFCRPDG